MIEILNLDQLVPDSLLEGLSESAFNQILNAVADSARAEWIRLAMRELHTTQADYVAGIQPVNMQPGIATISLVGELPNLLEHGMDRQELHDTLLGPKVPTVPRGQRGKHKSADGGVYRAIPFRHSVPGTVGQVGPAMGSAYGKSKAVESAKRLGQEVYGGAKALKPTIGAPGGAMNYGERLETSTRTVPGAVKVPKLKRYHAVDIYKGMIKLQKTYERATQNYYLTFRTIALDGEGNKVGTSPWVRKATKGKKLSHEVSKFVREQAPLAFEAYVKGLIG